MHCAHNLQIPCPSARLVTLTSTWIIPDITRTSSNNCLFLFILRRVILLDLHNSSDDTHPYSIIVNYHINSVVIILACFVSFFLEILVYFCPFLFAKQILGGLDQFRWNKSLLFTIAGYLNSIVCSFGFRSTTYTLITPIRFNAFVCIDGYFFFRFGLPSTPERSITKFSKRVV